MIYWMFSFLHVIVRRVDTILSTSMKHWHTQAQNQHKHTEKQVSVSNEYHILTVWHRPDTRTNLQPEVLMLNRLILTSELLNHLIMRIILSADTLLVKIVAEYQNYLMEFFLSISTQQIGNGYTAIDISNSRDLGNRMKIEQLWLKLYFISSLINLKLKYKKLISIQRLTFTDCNDCIVLRL